MTHIAGVAPALRQLYPQLDAAPPEPIARRRRNRLDVRLGR